MNVKILAVIAVLSGAAPAFGAPSANVDLGKDVSGEACQLQGQDIICGASLAGSAWSAVAVSLPANLDQRKSALLAAARAVPGSGLAEMSCDSPEALGGDDLLFACTARATGWPQIILLTANARGVWGAQGLPAMLPVLEAVLATASGVRLSPAQTTAAQAALQAKFPSRVLEAGPADFSGYRKAIEKGQQESAIGDFAGAETAYRNALDIETKLFGPDSFAVGQVLIELAVEVSNQGRFDEAAALFRRADPILQSATSASARARLGSYRAIDAANQRQYADALQYARVAVAARRRDIADSEAPDLTGAVSVVPPLLKGELAHDLRLEAEMAMRTGDMPGAEAAAQEALYITTQQPQLPLTWRPEMVSLMGEINARENRVVVAERDFADAVAMDKKILGDSEPTAMAQMRLGAFYADQQVYPAAIAAFRDGFAILDKEKGLRSQIVADQITPFLAAASTIDGSAADRRKLDADMFTAVQRIDGGIADQTIARVAARRAAADPALAAAVRDAEDAARATDDLRIALAGEHAKSDDERDVAREKTLAAQIAAASTHSDTLQAKVRTDFPDYARLATPSAVSLEDLQGRLVAHEAFIDFVIGVRASYVLLVTSSSLTVRPLDGGNLTADIIDLRSAFAPHGGQLPDFNLKLSYGLYRTLLGPVEPQMAGIDHLVVGSTGVLASMPFSLLVTADPGQAHTYTDAAWLIRSMAVAQVSSARAFVTLRSAKRTVAARPFLGVGNPSFSGTSVKALDTLASTCQQAGPVDPALLNALPSLPDTAAEVQAVARDLNAAPEDVLLGAAATEAALRAKPLEQYAVLYFATHGLLPGELHCQAEPGLVLSPPARPALSTAEDGLLSASEIAAFRLDADLVVLSACNTAAAGGTGFGGGALDGLADAFFNAGARAILASNWQVPSLATTELMTAMFADLAHDPRHDVTEALRQAQLSLIAQSSTSHPFDWAAFTLIGAGGG